VPGIAGTVDKDSDIMTIGQYGKQTTVTEH